MATPLKIKDGSGNIQEFTTSEESYIAYQIGLQLADASVDSAGALNKSTLGNNIGSFTDTFFNEPVGTHPATSITTGTTTTPVYQTTGTADEGDSDWQRPLMWVDAGGETGFKQMPDVDLNQAIDRYLTTVFTNSYPGSFKLGSASPGPDYSVHLNNAFRDTRTDGTSVQYNVYKRTSMTAPTAVAPLYIRDSSGFDGIQAMTDRQIKTTFGQRAKTRIMNSGIGTYEIRSATQGTPTNPGTWISAGAATDTKQTTSNQVYQRDSTVNFAANYTRGFTTPYITNFTSISQLNYTTAYTLQSFNLNYSAAYTRLASESFTRIYNRPYTNVYTKGYTKAYTGTYNKVYTGNYQKAYARLFQRNTLVNYTNSYVGTYDKVYTKNYTNSYTNTFIRQTDVNYQRAYTGTYNKVYTSNFVAGYQNVYSNQFQRLNDVNYQRAYTGTYNKVYTSNFATNYQRVYTNNFATNYQRGYLGTYNKVYTGNYQRLYTNNFLRLTDVNYQRGYVGNYNKVYTGNYVPNYVRATFFANNFVRNTNVNYVRNVAANYENLTGIHEAMIYIQQVYTRGAPYAGGFFSPSILYKGPSPSGQNGAGINIGVHQFTDGQTGVISTSRNTAADRLPIDAKVYFRNLQLPDDATGAYIRADIAGYVRIGNNNLLFAHDLGTVYGGLQISDASGVTPPEAAYSQAGQSAGWYIQGTGPSTIIAAEPELQHYQSLRNEGKGRVGIASSAAVAGPGISGINWPDVTEIPYFPTSSEQQIWGSANARQGQTGVAPGRNLSLTGLASHAPYWNQDADFIAGVSLAGQGLGSQALAALDWIHQWGYLRGNEVGYQRRVETLFIAAQTASSTYTGPYRYTGNLFFGGSGVPNSNAGAFYVGQVFFPFAGWVPNYYDEDVSGSNVEYVNASQQIGYYIGINTESAAYLGIGQWQYGQLRAYYVGNYEGSANYARSVFFGGRSVTSNYASAGAVAEVYAGLTAYTGLAPEVTYLRAVTFAGTAASSYGRNYEGNYQRVYTNEDGSSFAGAAFVNYRAVDYEGGTFNTNYQRRYTGDYQKEFAIDYVSTSSVNYDGATFNTNYQSVYTNNFATNYQSVYTNNFATNYEGPQFNINYQIRYTGNYDITFAINYDRTYTSNFAIDYEGPAFLTNYQTRYTGEYTNVFNTAYVTTYANAYDGTVFNAPYQTQYVGDYTGEYTIDYQSTSALDYEGTAFNTTYDTSYDKIYSADYVTNYTGIYTSVYTGAYNKIYTSDYENTYIGTYTGNYEDQYESVYENQYINDYLGNFIGDFSGETIDGTSETNETYTLYVRIA